MENWVADHFVTVWYIQDFFVMPENTFPLGVYDINISQGLRELNLLCLITKKYVNKSIYEIVGHFDRNPLRSRLGNEVNLEDGEAVFFTEVDDKVKAKEKIEDFGAGLDILGEVRVELDAGDPFLFYLR